ncbi:amidohydrolase family protein [Chloroflexota bacterium]
MKAKIDSHTHIGLEEFLAVPIPAEKLSRPAFQDPMENTIDNLLACMDANGINRAITFPLPLKEINRQIANDYVIQAARQHPERIIPFALVGDDTEHWLKQGAVGFKQQNILYAPERFNLFRAYHVMAEAGVPMVIHFRAGPGFAVTEQVLAILTHVPTLKIIVAHMGRHTPNTSQGVEAALLGLRDQSNVFFETSTVRDSAAIGQALSIVGPDRVLFGSDYPFNSFQDADPMAVEVEIILKAGLSPDVQEMIFTKNILHVLGIAEQTHERH